MSDIVAQMITSETKAWREAVMRLEREVAARDALLLAFWNEAAVSGLTAEMKLRQPFLNLDRGMRELGLLPPTK